MLLQNTLDLSTFEIVRFRIWNQTSNPNDYGIGTKYFNTNSGHEGYNRENIYTATGWRRAAYLDDIDKITNGEGSLGTRVKALEDMLNVDSAETVVSTWEEIQAFLDNVKEGTDLMTMLDDKLSKSEGGTIAGSLFVKNTSWGGQLRVVGDNTQAGIEFYHDDTKIGNLVTYAPDKLAWYDNVSKVAHVLLHAGNVGDYAAGGLKCADGIKTIDLNTIKITDGVIRFYYSLDNASPNAPINTGGWSNSVLAIPLHTNGNTAQFFFGYGSHNRERLCFRYNYDQDWKTIAFTDSTVEAAKKIVTASGADVVTTNGTDIITAGSVTIPNGRGIFSYKNDSISVLEIMSVSSNNNLSIGYSLAGVGGTYLFGDSITFRTGGSRTTAMTITEEGNVLVGSKDNTLSASLKTIGLTHVSGVSSAPVLGAVTKIGLAIGSNAYGMQQWIDGSGQGNIQVGRFDGTATAYALNLNPLGGAVNVGGNLAPNANNSLFLGTSSYRWSNVYSVGGNFSGRVLIGGAQDNTIYTLNVKGATSSQGIYSNFVYIGCGEDGTATGYGGEINRFGGANLYIQNRTPFTSVVFGDMEGTVNAVFRGAIGVAGLASFNGGALIPTGQTLTIGSVTIKEVATGEIEVNGNLHTTGTLASGGKAEEGTGGTGGASGTIREFTIDPPTDNTSSFKLEHSFNTEKVIVQIFELNGNSGKYEMILTDVEITDANNVTVTFGRKPTEYHKVYVMA